MSLTLTSLGLESNHPNQGKSELKTLPKWSVRRSHRLTSSETRGQLCAYYMLFARRCAPSVSLGLEKGSAVPLESERCEPLQS